MDDSPVMLQVQKLVAAMDVQLVADKRTLRLLRRKPSAQRDAALLAALKVSIACAEQTQAELRRLAFLMGNSDIVLLLSDPIIPNRLN